MEQKQVLVVCSDLHGLDFQNPLNNNIKILFNNPVYTFCNDKNVFPLCPDKNENFYDFIWFAGCNLINNIFHRNEEREIVGLEKIKKILKNGGIIIFTENLKYVEKYSDPDSIPIIPSLSLSIENIIDNSYKVHHKFNNSLLSLTNLVNICVGVENFFKKYFNVRRINDTLCYVYNKKKKFYKKYLKYKNKYIKYKTKYLELKNIDVNNQN